MSNSETTITTKADGGGEEHAGETVVVGGTSDHSALDQATIENRDRLNALENRFGEVGSRIDGVEVNQQNLSSSVETLANTVKESIGGLTGALSEFVKGGGETVKTAAEAVTEPVKEAVSDLAPSIKEHAFFRRWGGGKQ